MIKLKIISYDKILYNGKIIYLTAPGKYGYFQVLYNHEFFMSILKKGTLSFFYNNKNINKKKTIIIKKDGFLKVKKNSIVIFIN